MRCHSTSVRQISISSEPHRTIFLKLEWAKDLGSGFIILLSDGVSAWSGEVSEEDVSREAQEIEMERERYVGDLHLALTGEGPSAEGEYSFHLTPERPGSPLQLSYEKVQSDISFRLGVVELQAVPEPTEVIRELISHGLEQTACLRAKNQHLREENQKLRREQEHITKEMERYVQGKETLERDLYSRFVLVLNEKKAKLRALQERVRELEESIEENRPRKKKTDSEDREAIETATDKSPGEESDYGGSTEDEQEDEPRRPDPKPLTQEMPESSPMDDSLNDITDVAPCRKRRHRHLQQLETQAKRAALEQRQRSRSKRRKSKLF
ncbi:DNA repair protein XRCC4 isoform X2 [Pseudorasbora parva]|uniref:DNA repair protein XRCC4 isoform X2 n=1 Tax=Pseudorasbora parva TaxID=51549 RepID=UPI00351F351D